MAQLEVGVNHDLPYAGFVQVMKCSFCDQSQEDHPGGRRLIAGRGGVAICSDCVQLCVVVLESKPPDDWPRDQWWTSSNVSPGDRS